MKTSVKSIATANSNIPYLSAFPLSVCLCILQFLSLPETNLQAQDQAEKCQQARQQVQEAVLKGDGSEGELQAYIKAGETCPDMPEAFYNAGIIYQARKNYPEARKEFEKAHKLRPDLNFSLALAGVLLHLNELDTARKMYGQLQLDNPKEVRALQGLSLIYEKQSSLPQALETLQKALAIDPNNPVTHKNLAALYMRSGDQAAAIIHFKKVNELQPSDADAYLYLGVLYEASQRYAESIQALEQGARIDYNSARLQKALGVAYERVGDLEKSEVALRRAVDLDPEDQITKVNLALLLIQRKQEGVALPLLEAVIKKTPNDVRALNALGVCYAALGQYEQAEQRLSDALALEPANRDVLKNLSMVYQQTGNQEKLLQVREKLGTQ